jgi:hypothetical protein
MDPTQTALTDAQAVAERIIELVGFAVGGHLAHRAVVGNSTWPDLDLPLLNKVMDHIEAHPEEHDQSIWAKRRFDQDGNACGTQYCFAGHTVVMGMRDGEQLIWRPQTWRNVVGGDPLVATSGAVDVADAQGTINLIADRAQALLGLTRQEAERLFFAGQRREQLRRMVQALELAEQCRLARLHQAVAR